MIKGKRGKAQNDNGQKINYDSIIVHHKIKKIIVRELLLQRKRILYQYVVDIHFNLLNLNILQYGC